MNDNGDVQIIRNPDGAPKGAGAADFEGNLDTLPTEPVQVPVSMDRTGIGNAQRFVIRFGSIVRFVKPWGQWFIWDGKRWSQDATGEIVELAKRVAVEMFEEAIMLGDDKAMKWAVQSASEGRLTEMVSLAESDERVVALPKDFDATPYMLNVENGMVNLRDGSIREHQQSDMMSSLIKVTYVEGATDPLWTAFVERALPDPDVRAYVQKVMGSALAGNPVDQRFYLVQGPEASGKSTMLTAVRDVMGEYGWALDSDALLKKSGDAGVRNDLAALVGKRYVMTTEPTEGKGWDAPLIKRLTGGDPITARKLYHEFFEFVPLFVMFIASNTLPTIPSSDGAFWRRLRRIVFDQTIPEGERDRLLSMKLKQPEVQTAILAWLVQGCLAWQAETVLSEPKAVLEATQEYREDNDPLKEWVAACIIIKSDGVEMSSALRGSYEQWCRENGEKPIPTSKAWGAALRRAGFAPMKDTRVGRGTRQWRGGLVRRGPNA